MTRIYFRRFRVAARLGVLDHERAAAQPVVLDLEFTPRQLEAATDQLRDTLDYRLVKAEIEHVIAKRHYDLLENLAQTIMQRLVERFQLPYVKLHLEKPEIFSDMEAVGVCMEYREP